jgi:pimeloyl-ACP methyl ester carboxylesterase
VAAPARNAVLAVLATVFVVSLLGACSRSTRHAGGATTTAAGRGAVALSGIHWVPCQGSAGPAGYQCATILVPRDPARPGSGPYIPMALDRHPAVGQAIGSLVINPGGPGASGVDSLPQIVSVMPRSLLNDLNVVGFDPPGVARTAPIVCLGNSGLQTYFHEDPAPSTQSGFEAMVAEDRVFAAGCEARSGAELPYVSTVDAARDMDLLRQALGEAKLTYMGFSYGTFLGAIYAELYPSRVRAMVLDGALDPALSPVAQLDQQSAAIYRELEQFFSWCASNQTCGWVPGPDPVAKFEALDQAVRAHPLEVAGTGRSVGPAELIYGTAVTLYSPSSWPDLGAALAAAERGDGSIFLQLFDSYTERNPNGTYGNIFEANSAINCLDDPAPSLQQIQAAAAAAAAEAPIFGVANLYSEAQCSVWPVKATGRPGAVHYTGSAPIVVVGSTGDPVTPYAWARALAHQLGRAILLTRIGSGHTAYQFSSCIRSWVDRYLTKLTVPPAGVECPSN